MPRMPRSAPPGASRGVVAFVTSRRPGEGRDPYAAAVVLRDAVRRPSRNYNRVWLWVPAFAGTTWSVVRCRATDSLFKQPGKRTVWKPSLRANGSRECAAHIPLSLPGLTGQPSTPWLLDSIARLWDTGSPAFAGDDNCARLRDLAACDARGIRLFPALQSKGAGNAGRPMRPIAACAMSSGRAHTR